MTKINAILMADQVVSNTMEAQNLHATNRYGEKQGEKIHYSLAESLFQ